MLLHLVWDGVFASTRVLWWPFGGSWGNMRVPSLQRGWWNLGFEIVGALVLVWMWRQCELSDPRRRRDLIRQGVLKQRAPSGRPSGRR